MKPNYDDVLSLLRRLAHLAGLGIKTFCLVFLHSETVPDAIGKILDGNLSYDDLVTLANKYETA